MKWDREISQKQEGPPLFCGSGTLILDDTHRRLLKNLKMTFELCAMGERTGGNLYYISDC